jgi:hypothetical protein
LHLTEPLLFLIFSSFFLMKQVLHSLTPYCHLPRAMLISESVSTYVTFYRHNENMRATIACSSKSCESRVKIHSILHSTWVSTDRQTDVAFYVLLHALMQMQP